MEPLDPDLNPYQAPAAAIVDVPAHRARLPLAPAGHRFYARLLDNLLLILPAGLVALGCVVALDDSPVRVGTFRGEELGLLLGALSGGALFSAVLALNIYMLHTNGTTPGKRLLKLRIVASDGQPALLWKVLLLRMFTPFLINYFCGLFGLVDALFIFRRDGRCIHDHMADTVVITWDPAAPGDGLARANASG